MTLRPVDIDPATVPKVCRYLRTKQTAVTAIGGEILPWEAGANTSASFWCLATTSPVGPDDAPVHAADCREGRACYREKIAD